MAELIAEQTPPIIQGPSDKEKKYDRQLRLWAANGQQALEDAHILLINSGCGTVGVETLKNLILPGIGHFTIIDDAKVTESDLGVNFFLDESCLGKWRGECCMKFLQELNPDAEGDWAPSVPEDGDYTIIMYSTPVDDEALQLAEFLATAYKVPLISMHSAGFYSYFHIKYNANFPIVDTHPESTATTDLRLLSPWPELLEFVKELTGGNEDTTAEDGLSSLSNHEHGHIPYLVLLLYYLEEWKKVHGAVPEKYADKIVFRKMVAAGARTDTPEGGEENFDEAVAAVLKTISTPTLSSSVREVFEYKPNEDEETSSFWIITDAIRKFYEKHGALPLPGSVPDMKAESEVYVRLQNIYKRKARQDVEEVVELVHSHPKGHDIPAEEIEEYCKNAAFIKLIKDQKQDPKRLKQLADSELNAEFELSPTLLSVYLALKASERVPSNLTYDAIFEKIFKMVGNSAHNGRVILAAKEVARAQMGELHNISALTGGLVAQEVIKLITKQYVPIDNTCVFDGITSRMQIFKI